MRGGAYAVSWLGGVKTAKAKRELENGRWRRIGPKRTSATNKPLRLGLFFSLVSGTFFRFDKSRVGV
jgi:hypothetical protein